MRKGGLDYSKWDKMASCMSDSEEEGNNNVPEVTTFDEPQSVTFGGSPAARATDGLMVSEQVETSEAPSAPPRSSQPKQRKPITDDELAENGGLVFAQPNSSDGQDDSDGTRQLRYIWRQTRTEVTVVIPVPASARARDVSVLLEATSGILAENVVDLICVTMSRNGQQKVGCSEGHDDTGTAEDSGTKVLLRGNLPFQAKQEDDVDWELKDFPGTCLRNSCGWVRNSVAPTTTTARAAESSVEREERYRHSEAVDNAEKADCERSRGIEITLRKHCPVPNATVWWRSFLKGDPEIDVSSIQGRSNKDGHQSAWEEALHMFKTKMQERKTQGKIEV